MPQGFNRMVYGVYESKNEAQQNAPLGLEMPGNRKFLVPANRVHYVVCDEVERPMD